MLLQYYKSQAPHRTYYNDPSRGDYGSYRDADSYYKKGSDSYSYKPEYRDGAYGGDDKDSYYKTGGGDDYYKGDEVSLGLELFATVSALQPQSAIARCTVPHKRQSLHLLSVCSTPDSDHLLLSPCT